MRNVLVFVLHVINGFMCPQIYSKNFDNMLRLSMKKYFLERRFQLGPCAPKIIEDDSRCHTLSAIRKSCMMAVEPYEPTGTIAQICYFTLDQQTVFKPHLVNGEIVEKPTIQIMEVKPVYCNYKTAAWNTIKPIWLLLTRLFFCFLARSEPSH